MRRSLWGVCLINLLILAGLVLSGCRGDGVRIASIDPPFGSVAGDDDIVITGSGFKPGLSVLFRKRQAHRVVIESNTKIRVKSPPGPEGKVDVLITDVTGKTYVLESAFAYRQD